METALPEEQGRKGAPIICCRSDIIEQKKTISVGCMGLACIHAQVKRVRDRLQ